MSEKIAFLGYPFRIPEIRKAVEAAVQGHALLKCADTELTNLQLLDKIEKMMGAADLRLFDVTGHNVNVAVEYGIARALQLAPLLLYCKDERYAPHDGQEDVFSDLRGMDSLRYETFEELTAELRQRIPGLLSQAKPHLRSGLPRLQMRLQEQKQKDNSHWLVGDLFNAGESAANRVKVAMAGYLWPLNVREPEPIRIGTLVPREPPRSVLFNLETFNMIEHATGMEHILVELADETGGRYEQRGRLLATRQLDGTYTFSFEGLEAVKPIEAFRLPMFGLESP